MEILLKHGWNRFSVLACRICEKDDFVRFFCWATTKKSTGGATSDKLHTHDVLVELG